MNILVLGGTRFVGRHIVETLVMAGHRITVLNRGTTPDELPAGVERLRGDRDSGAAGLHALRGRTWDACVDVSGYTAGHVRPSSELLRASVQRYVFISAVASYGDPTDRPVRETHAQVQPADECVTDVDGAMYARLKVTCERIVRETYGSRGTILRPQIVAGPYDLLDRYSYWVRRAGQRGDMLAPGDGSDHVQVIDARDLARFTGTVIERDLGGAFNVVGPRLTWAEFLRCLGARELVWVDAEVLQSAGVTEDALPLFRPERGRFSGLMDVSSDRARAAGLTLTDPAVTARDTRAWLRDCRIQPALSREREAQVIDIARRRGLARPE